MPKYYDGQGADVSHWVETLLENSKSSEGMEIEILKLKAEIKRLKTKKKVIE